jgi:hypothetical protein
MTCILMIRGNAADHGKSNTSPTHAQHQAGDHTPDNAMGRASQAAVHNIVARESGS